MKMHRRGFLQSTAALAAMTSLSAMEIRGPLDVPPIQFAVEEIQSAARTVSDPPALTITLRDRADTLPTQAYRIARAKEGITVTGGDAVGAMYGGLEVAEAIRCGALDSFDISLHGTYIAQRGIKFNIPLDLRTPSYQSLQKYRHYNLHIV